MPNQYTLEDLINLSFDNSCKLIEKNDEINSANDGKLIAYIDGSLNKEILNGLEIFQTHIFKIPKKNA